MGNKRLIILLLALICFFILMGLTLSGRAKMYWPEKFVKDSMSWTQSLFYRPAGYISGLFDDIRELRVIYEENRTLKLRLSQYARDTQRLNDLESQNQRLKVALGFTESQKQSNKYTYRIAEVVSANTDPYNNIITINLGARDGIKENMSVMTVDGLVGRIQTVSEFSSNVQLLLDINDADNHSKAIAVTAKGKEGKTFGVIESYTDGKLIMTRVEQTDPVQVGDTILTSDLGKVYPSGIPIGKVTSKEPGKFGITLNVLIEPFASFRHIREVFVVEVPEVR